MIWMFMRTLLCNIIQVYLWFSIVLFLTIFRILKAFLSVFSLPSLCVRFCCPVVWKPETLGVAVRRWAPEWGFVRVSMSLFREAKCKCVKSWNVSLTRWRGHESLMGPLCERELSNLPFPFLSSSLLSSPLLTPTPFPPSFPRSKPVTGWRCEKKEVDGVRAENLLLLPTSFHHYHSLSSPLLSVLSFP